MKDLKLTSPSVISSLIEEYDFKFSKSLGQNFLIDGNIVRRISEIADITDKDYVLEIGPGIGTLTEELAFNAKKVVAVEIDEKLLPILDETLQAHDNVEIIHGDILNMDIIKIIDENMDGGPIKVVANLPYYVTTPIIAKLLEEESNIHSIVVMVQKEVGERIVASPGSKQYGSLSVFVNFYTYPEIGMKVPKTVFMPQPKVDSVIIKLKMKEKLPKVDREVFFKVVKSAFGKRRKTILNALSSGELGIEKKTMREVLESLNIPTDIRAENLKIEDFIKISQTLPPLNIY